MHSNHKICFLYSIEHSVYKCVRSGEMLSTLEGFLLLQRGLDLFSSTHPALACL